MPLIIDVDEHTLLPHERYGYCTNVDLTTEDGFALLTILFTTNGSQRYPITFPIDVTGEFVPPLPSLWHTPGMGYLVSLNS